MVLDNEKEKLGQIEQDFSFIKECLWLCKTRSNNWRVQSLTGGSFFLFWHKESKWSWKKDETCRA